MEDLKKLIGKTIELLEMNDDPRPVPVGTRGIITGINNTPWNGEFQIKVTWENGSGLMLIYPKDKFKVVE